MGLLCSIILILPSAVDRLWDQFPVSHTIASQFIRNDLPGFTFVTPYQPLEETLRCCAITLGLQVDINHFTVLIYSTPQVMLLTVDLDGNFIDVERVAVASVFSFQSTGV